MTPPLSAARQPHTNIKTIDNSEGSNWLLDNGASHHVISNQNNFSIHVPYSEIDDVVIGNDKGLPITH